MLITKTRIAVLGALGALAVVSFLLMGAFSGGARNDAKTSTGDVPALQPSGPLEQFDASRGTRSVAQGAAPGGSEAYTTGGSAAGAPPGTGSVAPIDGALPQTDPALQGLLDRKIVQSTSVDMGVKEVGREFQEIIRIATTAGGFVATSSFSKVDDQTVADLTVRVPNAGYQDVLAQIRGKGDVTNETSDANDVTEEYTDLSARLRTLQATEQRYLELLAVAKDVNDILTVQDRLDSVRGQIEQVQGRINLLDHLTDLATITVHLRPLGAAAIAPTPNGNIHPLNAASNAWERSLDALRGIAAGALVVVVFSWWLVPPLAALGFGARWWAGRRPRAASAV